MGLDYVLVAAPPCAPIRHVITSIIEPYGFKDVRIDSWAQTQGGQRLKDGAWLLGANDWVVSNLAYVWGNQQAIRWLEYLLLRSGKFMLLSKPKDARNESWAVQYGNVMPKPWANEPCLLARQRQEQTQQKLAIQSKKQRVKPFWRFW